jgi:hypothetical protein
MGMHTNCKKNFDILAIAECYYNTVGMDNFLLWGGVIAGPLFIVIFLVEGAIRDGYNPMRQPVSALSVGKRGWVQQANFFVNGILLLACALGLSSALQAYGGSFWGPFFIGIYGAGLLGAGMFVTDVGVASREGSKAATRSRAGILHDIFSTFVFASLFAACFVFAHLFAGRGDYGWEGYSIVTGILYFCGFVLFARGFSPSSTLAPIAGLLQRLTIALGALWLAFVALHLLGLL